MNQRLIHFSTVALRWLAIALLLAIPVGSGIAWAIGLANRYNDVIVFGQHLVRETCVRYVVEYRAILFAYSSGWEGTPPIDGKLFNLPGLDVNRYVYSTGGRRDPGGTRGWEELSIRVRWWLLLLANIPPILLALGLAWPWLRRRALPGRCPVCGYDLRATPERCPECGSVIERKTGATA